MGREPRRLIIAKVCVGLLAGHPADDGKFELTFELSEGGAVNTPCKLYYEEGAQKTH